MNAASCFASRPMSSRLSTGCSAKPIPYLSTVFQAPVHEMRDLAHLRIEVVSPRRAPGKLKYLASSESAAGAFINDVVPERAAAQSAGLVAGSELEEDPTHD